ncbi:hypothetical protein ACPV5X_16590 [Legionella pneumophila]|uniref:hypothetical protein n=1 Tax=Legionella pneumophila TaxID=446 RepID=UPI003CB5EC53
MPEKKLKNKEKHALKPHSFSSARTFDTVLSSIIKSLPGSIYWKDKDGYYLGGNDLIMLDRTVSKVRADEKEWGFKACFSLFLSFFSGIRSSLYILIFIDLI